MGKNKREGDDDLSKDEGAKDKIKRQRLSNEQLAELEAFFQKDIYPSTQLKEDLAKRLDMKPETVSKWFINRRVKLRNETGQSGVIVSHPTYAHLQGTEPNKVVTRVDKYKYFNLKKAPPALAAPKPPKEVQKIDREKERQWAIKDREREKLEKEKIDEFLEAPFANIELKESLLDVEKAIVDPATEFLEEVRRRKHGIHPTHVPPTLEEIEFWDKFKKENNIVDELNEHSNRRPRIQENENFEDFSEDENNKNNSSGYKGNIQEISTESLPLWKQLYHMNKDKIADNSKRETNQQNMLRFIYQSRKQLNLPPFFVMLTGPTIVPYRMEEFTLILGRNTSNRREADIHIGNSSLISHVHATIEYDFGLGGYHIINNSKNGIEIAGQDSQFVQYFEIGAKVPLANPSVIRIGGIPIFFQVFVIQRATPLPSKEKVLKALKPIERNPSPEPVEKKEKKAPAKPRRIPGKMSYSSMILEAIKFMGGEATHKEITDYIGEHFRDEVSDRKTWKNSVGGVLSTHPLFEVVQGARDAKRGRGQLWKLRDPNSGPKKGPKAVAPETTAKNTKEEEEEFNLEAPSVPDQSSDTEHPADD